MKQVTALQNDRSFSRSSGVIFTADAEPCFWKVLMRRLALAVFLSLYALAAVADAPSVYAIRGATVHRVSAPPLTNATLVIRGGLIEAVGTNVTIPDDATVIDAAGKHVYPGFIDAQTKLGLTAPAASPTPGATSKPISAATNVVDLIAITDEAKIEKRTTGVTTVLIGATGEVFNGRSVLLNLGDRDLGDSIVKQPATVQVAFATKSWGTFPDSLMGAIYHVRQTILDAQTLSRARAVYDRNPAGKKRPAIDPNLEALQPVVSKSIPIVFAADSAEMIRRVLKLSKELDVRSVIAGARGGFDAADDLKGTDVFVSVDFPKPPATEREDEPLRLIRWRVESVTTPRELAKRSVRFALVSNGAPAGDFVAGVRKAIDNGLTAEQALRAVTLAPAQILGVDRQLGSLDAGKIANVIVTDRPVFQRERKIEQLFIDGRLVSMKTEEPKATDGAASPLAGRWNVQVRANTGEVALQVTFSGSGTDIRGSYSGDRGAGELAKVSLDAQRIRFSFIEKTTESGESSEWTFDGTLEGNEIRGNVTTSLGTFPFTGSRPQ